MEASSGDKRFREVEEMIGATLRFPGERLASFICSFGASGQATYSLVGTEGSVKLTDAYEYVEPIQMEVMIGERKQKREFEQRDQFAPELLYFSDCILNDKEPEPSGLEGLADVRIVEAIYRSVDEKQLIVLPAFAEKQRPSLQQEIHRPAHGKPRTVKTESPSGEGA